mmetsp:Transcript_5550/g.12024  ORF Transcript_5550/g.12024 Transcript_5550/m.12024 type:complete len:204 (+) Transcript_5550:1-612(+)
MAAIELELRGREKGQTSVPNHPLAAATHDGDETPSLHHMWVYLYMVLHPSHVCHYSCVPACTSLRPSIHRPIYRTHTCVSSRAPARTGMSHHTCTPLALPPAYPLTCHSPGLEPPKCPEWVPVAQPSHCTTEMIMYRSMATTPRLHHCRSALSMNDRHTPATTAATTTMIVVCEYGFAIQHVVPPGYAASIPFLTFIAHLSPK